MRAVYLPFLPLPVLAAAVAFSACSRSHGDEQTTHVIPPAVALVPASAPRPAVAPTPPTGENAPSEQELQEFHRPVAK